MKKTITCKLMPLFLALTLVLGLVPQMAVAAQDNVLEITTDDDGTILYKDLYNQIISSGYTSTTDSFVVDIYGGSLVSNQLLAMYGDQLTYTFEANKEYTVYPCTVEAVVAPSNFTATKDEDNAFYIMRKVSEEPVSNSSVVVSANISEAGTVAVKTGDTETTINTETATEIFNNTEYTVIIAPNEGYAVDDVLVTKKESGQDVPVTDQFSFSGDGSHKASAVFTSEEGQEYTVQVTFVKPEFHVKAPHNTDDSSYNLYIPEGSTKEEMETALISTVISSTTPEKLMPVTVTYQAGEIDSQPQWKPLDYRKEDGNSDLHAFGEGAAFETVRFSFAGNNQYPSFSVEAKVCLIEDPIVTIDIRPQQITYGSSYNYMVTTDPENVEYLVIAINMSDTSVYVQVPDGIRAKLGYHYTALSLATQGGIKLEDFSKLINDLADELDSLAGTSEDTGIDTDALRRIPGFIGTYTDVSDTITIELDKMPTESGSYILWAITAESGFTTAADYADLEIVQPQNGIMLQFKQIMDETTLSLAETNSFLFGGELKGVQEYQNDDIKAEYFVWSEEGAWVMATLNDVLTTPGRYQEAVSYIGGDQYSVPPISREFTVIEKKAVIKFEDTTYLTTAYDGEFHSLTAGVYTENGVRLSDATLSYIAMDMEDPSNYKLLENTLPKDAGFYIVMASYAGSDEYPEANAMGTVTITKANAVLSIHEYQTVYGDPIDLTKVSYTAKELAQSDLNRILSTLSCSSTEHTVGIHDMTVKTYHPDSKNYAGIQVTVGKHVISPRALTIVIDAKEKQSGDSDPEFTYRIEGTLAAGDSMGKVTLSRESGEIAGTYKITADVEPMANYSIKVVEGQLTIRAENMNQPGNSSNESSNGPSLDSSVELSEESAKNSYDAPASGVGMNADTGDQNGPVLYIIILFLAFVMFAVWERYRIHLNQN